MLQFVEIPADLIRKIRDQFGDDKCWMDWEALFKLLPEGYTPPKQDTQIQLEHCERYLKCKSDGTEYIPPARWVIGPPDKSGLWLIILSSGHKITFNYTKGLNYPKGWDTIRQSFGPIPQEPI